MAGPTILAACSSGHSSSSGTPVSKHFPWRVPLFGNSLAWEAEPYWTGLNQKDNEAALTYDTIGGTATAQQSGLQPVRSCGGITWRPDEEGGMADLTSQDL